MAMKEVGRTVYKSMQGREVDLDKLRNRNETTLAVGNARVNARGDEIGAGGKIIKKREDIMAEYYTGRPEPKED
jgi:hypothetical protein